MKLAKLLFGVALCTLSIGFGVFGSAAKSKSKKIPLEIMVNFTAEVKVYQSNNIEKEVCFLMTIISSFQEKLFADGLQPKPNACYSCHLSRRGPSSCVGSQNQQLLKVQAIKTLHV